MVLELEEQVNRQNSLNSIASPIEEILTNIGNDSQQEIEGQSLCNILSSSFTQNENNQNLHHNTTTE